ncbi:MAG: carbamoyl-phosphate synthase (glutamine-hydrolyzing) large subunit [Labilithrix sp.]|nr:carbamoyl-phosphate synthase (glutamine-hydrolyzing) large subunit [Labilithrix sp.]
MLGAYLPKRPRRVLVIGSGALQIGQAGEFDYSGSQAIKALKEEGVHTVLVNPNIATIQTSAGLADRVYLVAITPENVRQIIERENVDALLLSFGGQTALNTGLALDADGTLSRSGVRVLGTPVRAIRDTEDRGLFVARLREIGVKTARSRACTSADEARDAALALGFPVMLRGGFALGGMGSGIVEREADLEPALKRAFRSETPQVLVEECLRGWKEIEYEIVRDARDNCIAVCSMENLDPMGVHTGESIVVAPTQTLTEHEHQELRAIALRTVRHIGIVGECNIQYAVDPRSFDYRVIEINARLSRSSALASKATGYPLAYVAAKIALGFSLPEIPNGVTRRTTAFFEPALDYIVCKMPRWDLDKFRGATLRIGSEMKSVGEVMALGRNFAEVLQKALRMLDIGVDGLDPDAQNFEDLEDALRNPTPVRIFAVAHALARGLSRARVAELSGVDPWFLGEIESVLQTARALRDRPLDDDLLLHAKRLGFSDRNLAALSGAAEQAIRERRKAAGIVPGYARIDTLAAEFPADVNYAYASYNASAVEIPAGKRRRVIILGSGPYRIGSSVEFDWCCVAAAKAASELGFETVMVNNNPETVSTDHDESDVLVFDEISVESLLDLCARVDPVGVVVSMGGQLPNRLALELHRSGIPILGTAAECIDVAEDRKKFGALLDDLGIDQPLWAHVTGRAEADEIVHRLGGYPVLVRPSYVLSGAAMTVAHAPAELERILERASRVSPAHPVVITKFETRAREIEFDAVARDGELLLSAISEHIEDAGVHSGDATLVLPPQRLHVPVIRRVREIGARLARALRITGPFNVQFLAKNDTVKVIECNLRASRSLPFVSKATGRDFVAIAMRVMLGASVDVKPIDLLELDYVAVKSPKFSFARIAGADPMLGVEMASTGEVACFGRDLSEALLESLVATGFRVPQRGVLLSLGPLEEKYSFYEEARAIAEELRLPIFATAGTYDALQAVGIPCTRLTKHPDEAGASAMQAVELGLVDLVINVPREFDAAGRPDGYLIRRAAVDAHVPLITELQLARAVVGALRVQSKREPRVLAWNDIVQRVAGG